MSDGLVKRCNRCGELKPLTAFYHRYRRRTLRGRCKACESAVANVSRSKLRHALEIQAIIVAELTRHGPLSTTDLAVQIKDAMCDDTARINCYVVAQQAARIDGVIGTPRKGHGSIWHMVGDERYQARPMRRVCYVKDIGLDAENIAWMREQQTRREQREQRIGRC